MGVVPHALRPNLNVPKINPGEGPGWSGLTLAVRALGVSYRALLLSVFELLELIYSCLLIDLASDIPL